MTILTSPALSAVDVQSRIVVASRPVGPGLTNAN